MIGVRTAGPGDLAEVLAVGRAAWSATFPDAATPAYAEAGLRRYWTPDSLAPDLAAGRVVVGIRDGGIAGVALVRPEPQGSFLSRLYVHPDEQRKGVGGALLAEVVRRAAGPVHLTVLATNSGAIAFYEAHGFRAVGREPDPDGDIDQVRMTRQPVQPASQPSVGAAADARCRR